MESDYITQENNLGAKVIRFNFCDGAMVARHVIGAIQSWRGSDSHIFFVLDLSTLLTNYKFTLYGFFKDQVFNR